MAAALLVAAFLAYAIWGFRAAAVAGFAVRSCTPLALAAMCGILCERTGVINIGIEGQMLLGAFAGFFGAAAFGVVFGVLAAAIIGALGGAFLAVCAVSWRVDQIIAGAVINIVAMGFTTFFYRPGFVIGSLPTWQIPLLADLPLLGPIFFRAQPLAFLTFAVVIGLQVTLFRTTWGLRTTAVGEHPGAADTVGVNVARYRYGNVMLGGALAGLAGAMLSVEITGSFDRAMTAGRGFLALAIVIMGRWRPMLAWTAALLFGLLSGLVNQLNFDQVIDVPPQFVAMVPYGTTIVVLAVFSTRVRPPAAAGRPYP